MNGAKNTKKDAHKGTAHCEDGEYLPHIHDDFLVASFSDAISVCEYFVAEQKPEDGLAALVDFLRRKPEYRRQMRQLGQARLAAGHPEIAAVLFRAVLQWRPAEARIQGASSNELDTAVLEQLDSPDDASDFNFITRDGSEKRSTRTYSVGRAAKYLNAATPPIEEDQPRNLQGETAQKPAIQNSNEVEKDAPTQEDLLDHLLEIEVEPDSLDFSLSEQLGFFELDDELGDPVDLNDSDWADTSEADDANFEPWLSVRSLEEQDWEQYVEDALEYEEAPTRDDLADVSTTTTLTREQRCTQQAIEIAQRFDWDDSGVQILRNIFLQYSWSAAKAALIRQLEREVSQSELALAHELRILWSVTPEFSLSFGKYPHFILSWPLAIQIIRSYRGEPDIDEIEFFLWEARDIWYTTNHLRISYPAFRDYVKARISLIDADGICNNAMDWTDGVPISANELDSVSDDLNNSPKMNDFKSYGLSPAQTEDIAARVGITEWHEQVESWATPKEYNNRLDSRDKDDSD